MKSVRFVLALLWAAVPAWSAPLVRVEVPILSAPVSPIVLPAVLPNAFTAPSVPLGLTAAPQTPSVPSAPSAVHLDAAVAVPAAALAAPALRAAPAEGPSASAAPQAAPQPEQAPELVALKMPNGKTISVLRGFMDESRRIKVFGSGPDGILLDLGPSEASFGMRAGDLVSRDADWALFSHDGRLTRLQQVRGGDDLVGGPARSVLIVAGARARELGLARGAVVAKLGEGSTVLEVRDALVSGEWTAQDYAEAMAENAGSEPRHFLDSLVAVFDEMAQAGGAEGARAAGLRWEVIMAVAKHPRTDAHLRMQAATLMWKHNMPRMLFRWRGDLLQKWQVAYQWTDTWIHETGHQLVATYFRVPLMEKRVHAHGAGFIATPQAARPKQLAIDAAGGAAEVAAGATAAALGAWALSGLHGWALAAAALPALALTLLGLHMAYTAVAHAANDLQHMFGLLGWTRAEAFMAEAIAESSKEGLAVKRPGMTVPVSVFYRVAFRLLALKLYFRG